MSNIYTWSVVSLDCYPTAESQTNVVFSVNWVCIGSNNAGNPNPTPENPGPNSIYGQVYGQTPVTYTAGSPFTPYLQLTNAQVIGWVQDALGQEGVASVQSNIDTQIENQANPPVTQPPLPWATPQAPVQA